MYEKVTQTISHHNLIPYGSSVLCALSGGADSVALFHILFKMSNNLHTFTLCCAHINHGIRGEAADNDEDFVRVLCQKYGVKLFVLRKNVPEYANSHHLTCEQAGRILRYEFFDSCGCDVVATAHHMDDQVESIFLHMIRGSGLSGLCGMDYKRGNVIHPLLDVRRSEIENYIETNHLTYCTDKTNLIPDAARNKVRLNIIPYITENLNPGFVQALSSMAKLLRCDDEFLTKLALNALDNCVIDNCSLDRKKLLQYDIPVLSRALRIATYRAGAHTDIEDTHIYSLIEMMKKQTGYCLDLPHIKAYNEYDKLCFSQKIFTPPTFFCICPEIPGITTVADITFITNIEFCNTLRTDCVCMDYDKLPHELVLRTRQSGDSFHPLGACGKKKLKDFLIDKKIPRNGRNMPLLCCGNTVLCIIGERTFIANNVAVNSDTKRMLTIKIQNTVEEH